MNARVRAAIAASWAAALLALGACTSAPQKTAPAESPAEVSVALPDGVVVAEAIEVSATVTAVDTGTRRVTLAMPDGKQTTYVARKDAVNFDQIRVGDQVKATVVDSLAVFIRQKGTGPMTGEAAAIALAPKGTKPMIVMADTAEVAAQITAIDATNRKVTVALADGTSRTVTIGRSVDLSGLMPGQEIVMRATEAVAVAVEKP